MANVDRRDQRVLAVAKASESMRGWNTICLKFTWYSNIPKFPNIIDEHCLTGFPELVISLDCKVDMLTDRFAFSKISARSGISIF